MKRFFVVMVVLAIAIALSVGVTGCGNKTEQNETVADAAYHCPMHPTVVSDKPGDCPICGMRLVPIEKKEPAVARYTCPMHPSVISENPEDPCPICGMDLVPVKE